MWRYWPTSLRQILTARLMLGFIDGDNLGRAYCPIPRRRLGDPTCASRICIVSKELGASLDTPSKSVLVGNRDRCAWARCGHRPTTYSMVMPLVWSAHEQILRTFPNPNADWPFCSCYPAWGMRYGIDVDIRAGLIRCEVGLGDQTARNRVTSVEVTKAHVLLSRARTEAHAGKEPERTP